MSFPTVNPTEYPFGMYADEVLPGAEYIAVPTACGECQEAGLVQDGHIACSFSQAPPCYALVNELGPMLVRMNGKPAWVELYYTREALHYHPVSPIGGGMRTGYGLGPNEDTIMQEAENLAREFRHRSVDLEDAKQHMRYLLESKSFEKFWTYCDLMATNPPHRAKRSLYHYRALRDILKALHRMSKVSHDLHDFARVVGWGIRLAGAASI